MFKREKINSYYIHDTPVENVFINEFLPDAPGNYVKVYLFALMYADIEASIENDDIAKQLSLTIEEVLSAWAYWEERGVIIREYKDKQNKLVYNVSFVGLKEKMLGINGKSKDKKQTNSSLPSHMNDEELKNLYKGLEQILGRMLQGNEPMTILGWLRDYDISPDLILYAYNYCKKERNNTKVNYVGAVVKEWSISGLKTLEEVEEHLQENDNRRYLYKRVMKALGFMRNPTEEEKRIMDVWFDDLNLSINEVLEACKKTSGISNPNINYVNKVLTSSKDQGKVSTGGGSTALTSGKLISLVMKSYEEDRKAGEELAEARREEVYKRIPKIKAIDQEVLSGNMEITSLMLARGPEFERKIEEIKNMQEKLLDEKAYLLTENNYKIDYLDIEYSCPICKDEGILEDGSRCSCFAERLEQKTKMLEKEVLEVYNGS